MVQATFVPFLLRRIAGLTRGDQHLRELFIEPAYAGKLAYVCAAACSGNVRFCRCDTRSHLARELADWRADYVGRVVPGACSCPAPPCRALPVTAGCGAQGKAQGSAVP